MTDLALQSKQFWGYTPEFMQAALPDLTILPAYIEANPVFLLEDESRPVGFYSLHGLDEWTMDLVHLFVEPGWIGKGYGKRLWLHALDTARHAGFHKLRIEADPNAEPFYQKMGAIRVGEVPSIVASTIPGRVLPLLEKTL